MRVARWTCLWAAFGWSVAGSGAGEALPGGEMILWSRGSSSGAAQGEVQYTVPWAALLSAGSAWDPTKSALPVDVPSFIGRARESLEGGSAVGEKLEFKSMMLGAVMVRVSAEGSPRASLERWFVVFEFAGYRRPRPAAQEFWVVMLLDGTIATERAVSNQR